MTPSILPGPRSSYWTHTCIRSWRLSDPLARRKWYSSRLFLETWDLDPGIYLLNIVLISTLRSVSQIVSSHEIQFVCEEDPKSERLRSNYFSHVWYKAECRDKGPSLPICDRPAWRMMPERSVGHHEDYWNVTLALVPTLVPALEPTLVPTLARVNWTFCVSWTGFGHSDKIHTPISTDCILYDVLCFWQSQTIDP